MRDVRARVGRQLREQCHVPDGAAVTCLVSGGADSTCLWHVLGALGLDVRAVHVHHGLRGADADADARFCVEALGAEVVRAEPAETEAALRELRYRLTEPYGLRATGHTASDQVETVLLRLLASGATGGIRPRRADGVVRPLLTVWGEETRAYCTEHGLAWREDATNPATKRGLIREQVLPLLEEVDPRARTSLLALAEERPGLPRALERSLVELLSSRHGSAAVDLGDGLRAVREYDELRLEGSITWGPWRISSATDGLVVRRRRPGDRLAGRRKKVQDLLVDAKVARAERDDWPMVALPDGPVVAVPGIAVAPGWAGVVDAVRADR
jgi:tRNA(Ile)-lysidine synthase